jgi:RPE3 domain-containing protein
MPSSVNYLGSGTGARIEPNRVDNLGKTRLNETQKVNKFDKVLNQEKAKSVNQAQKNASKLDDKSSISSAMNKKVSAKYANEAADQIPFSELNQTDEFKGESAQRSNLREHRRDLQNSSGSFNYGIGIKQRIEAGIKAREKEAGTDFALKELSCQFEQQILGILWNLAFSSMDREFEGGLGEELFHKELVNEMVKLADTGEMGEIAQSIYDNLKEQSDNNKKIETAKIKN